MANNPLFSLLGGGRSALPPNISGLLQQFQQFRQGFQGNPQQQIQQLLNSGRISQSQYDQAVQMANELRKYIN